MAWVLRRDFVLQVLVIFKNLSENAEMLLSKQFKAHLWRKKWPSTNRGSILQNMDPVVEPIIQNDTRSRESES